jgi:hypothetical protein
MPPLKFVALGERVFKTVIRLCENQQMTRAEVIDAYLLVMGGIANPERQFGFCDDRNGFVGMPASMPQYERDVLLATGRGLLHQATSPDMKARSILEKWAEEAAEATTEAAGKEKKTDKRESLLDTTEGGFIPVLGDDGNYQRGAVRLPPRQWLTKAQFDNTVLDGPGYTAWKWGVDRFKAQIKLRNEPSVKSGRSEVLRPGRRGHYAVPLVYLGVLVCVENLYGYQSTPPHNSATLACRRWPTSTSPATCSCTAAT